MCCLLLFLTCVLLHCSITYPMGFACKGYITCMTQQGSTCACLFVSMSVSLCGVFVCAYRYICLSVGLCSVYYVCPFMWVCVHYISLCVCAYVYVVSVCVCLLACLSICLSVHLYTVCYVCACMYVCMY